MYTRIQARKSLLRQQATILHMSLSAMQAKSTGFQIHYYAEINEGTDRSLSFFRPVWVVQRLAFELKSTENAIVESRDTGGGFGRIVGRRADGLRISVLLRRNPQGMGNSTILLIRVRYDADRPIDLAQVMTEVDSVAAGIGSVGRLSVHTKGIIPMMLTDAETKDLVAQVLGSVKARPVEGVLTDGFASISAYCPKLETYLLTGDSKMNLQIAVRPDTNQPLTLVHVGTPIIMDGY
ncbi:YwmB family TATA-box binding protein [Alicyclobacillus tolerans]|uniref:YwmB family TATA-box binding protein n=1 Tax=Alicyclobacillus tolerans TaxID=90970 RepID=UPI001F2FE9F8|nr:YwmB family TATA-box binding protein [Alicyclobacillus tolerans]MCF8565928.1 YwmB family TATA-box binding protein [Alicyclobacillus tolerans]